MNWQRHRGWLCSGASLEPVSFFSTQVCPCAPGPLAVQQVGPASHVMGTIHMKGEGTEQESGLGTWSSSVTENTEMAKEGWGVGQQSAGWGCFCLKIQLMEGLGACGGWAQGSSFPVAQAPGHPGFFHLGDTWPQDGICTCGEPSGFRTSGAATDLPTPSLPLTKAPGASHPWQTPGTLTSAELPGSQRPSEEEPTCPHFPWATLHLIPFQCPGNSAPCHCPHTAEDPMIHQDVLGCSWGGRRGGHGQLAWMPLGPHASCRAVLPHPRQSDGLSKVTTEAEQPEEPGADDPGRRPGQRKGFVSLSPADAGGGGVQRNAAEGLRAPRHVFPSVRYSVKVTSLLLAPHQGSSGAVPV